MRSPFARSSLLAGLGLFLFTPAISAPLPDAGATLVSPGDVLFCDVNGGHGLMRYSPADGSAFQVSASNLLTNPLGVAVLSSTTALVTNYNPGRLVRVDLGSGIQSLVTDQNFLAGNPDGITIGKNGLAYVTNLQGARVIEVDPLTGLQRLVTSGGLLSSPIFIAPLDETRLVVTSPGGGVVEVNIANGTQRRISSGGLLRSPQGVAVLPDGALLVADYEAASLFRIDATTGGQTLVANGIQNAWGVTTDNQGYAYVSRYASSITPLVRVDLLTGEKTPITTVTATGFGIQVYLPSTDPGSTIPDPPADFTAGDGAPGGVTLHWSAVPRVTGYRIYRDDQPVALPGPTDTMLVDVPAVGTHEYCITAFNLAGESTRACDTGTRRAYIAEPRIQFVRDVPADQGGQLAIGWLASEYDLPASHLITSYRVWRRLPFTTEPAGLAGAAGLDAASEIRARANSVGTIEYWEPILTLPAGFREGYGAVAATTRDSLPDSNPFTAYFVSALTADPFVFYDSAVDSGYSVDNLAPPPPPQLAGAYGSAGAVRLSWRTAYAPDLGTYEVWRGQSRDLDLVHDEFLAATTDTAFTDEHGGVFFYKVLARDVHGNRSMPSVLSPLDIPTPAWVLDSGEEWRDGALTIVVQLVRDFGWSAATVLRAESPDIDQAVIVASDLAPVEPGRFEYREKEVPAAGALWYWMRVSDGGQRLALAGPVVVEPAVALARTAVFQAAPNPSRGAMSLGFVVGRDVGGAAGAPVRARIFDAAGRRVRDLDLGALPPGVHDVRWDRRDDRGAAVGAGVYRLALTIGGQTFRRSVVLLP